jgi:Secretion system C-terminal sorting domain
LLQGTEYPFTITADSLSQGDKRFELRMGTAAIATVQNDNDLNIKLTPNPATDEVMITYHVTENQPATLRLLNMTGATVLKEDLSSTGSSMVNLKTLAAGIYIVEITAGNKTNTQKLIKE